MSTISNVTSHLQAANAYKKALGASVKSAAGNFGNKPGKLNSNTVAAIQNASAALQIDKSGLSISKSVGPASFPELLSLASKDYISKLKKAERKTVSAIEENTSIAGVMGAVNESEIVLLKMIGLRDRFINAYQEILKMPL